MKHRVAQRRLGRTSTHRLAMLKSCNLRIFDGRHERIETTVAKAKELRKVADKVVTLGKKDSEQSRQSAAEMVKGDDELFKLFTEIAYRYKYRMGGYTRVIRSRTRDRDAAQMAFIEFVDRVGELRPARPPLKSLLPKSAEVLAQTTSSPDGENNDKKDDPPPDPDSKPKRFFGLF